MADNNIEQVEKKNKGRQRVEMKRMEKESNRLVTFSKRRSGLFKKASELCTLCGAEAAIIVFSPGRKVFSFGHPSVDTVINRYLMADSFFRGAIYNNGESSENHDPTLMSSYMNLTMINNQIELEKKESKELFVSRKTRGEEYKWAAPIGELGLEDLKKFQVPLDELKSEAYKLYLKFAKDGTKTGSAVEPAYNFPPEMVEGQNPIPSHFGVHPHLMVPTNLVEGPNNYDHSQMMMIQPPMGGFGDSSFTMGSNGISMNHHFNTNGSSSASGNSGLSLPNPMGLGFPASNFFPSFQGENNPMEGGQFIGHPPMPPLNMQGMNPIPSHFQTFTPLLMGGNGPNAPGSAFLMEGNGPNAPAPTFLMEGNGPNGPAPTFPVGGNGPNAPAPAYNHQGGMGFGNERLH
ncbi:hypothetical protein SOVF_025530 [Spinacia oleracea]|uniref:Floral homeotic protein AGAMOUS-like n=1 Tax=Spinacia oleracea TaxID=3562 RepID=A0A9R0K9N5_SPIOL|nr:floral homeotic protein AGAMOUS-like [Spinacia oleracea]KNA23348.1 hypothetical protein SOVF_025530 [Spinacia oleracea]